MKEKISKLCASMEREKNIRILFAVENGSRAWRMESVNSDYDVRFVFVRPIEEYIQVHVPAEVIEVSFDKGGNPCNAGRAYIDGVGFDIFKFVRMLSSSNPATVEWLVSDIVYYGSQNKVLRDFALKNFSPVALYHHYKSMCRTNYLKYLKSGTMATYKKYLYAYRGLVNAKWVVNNKSVPPIVFTDALKKMKGIMPEAVLTKLRRVIELKSKGREKDIIQNIVVMDNYIEEFLKSDSEAPVEKSHATLNALNLELRRIVLQK